MQYMYGMTKTVAAAKVGKNIIELLQKIQMPGGSVVITEDGHPKGVLMSFDEFEGWKETLDIMSDPEEVAAIRESLQEIARGEVISFDELQKNIGA